MERTGRQERRSWDRYPLVFPISYRVAQRKGPPLAGAGTTCDISPTGVSFLCRDALPVGSHIEMVAQWPGKTAAGSQLELRMTGFVIRSSHAGTVARVTSHKLCTAATEPLPYAASA